MSDVIIKPIETAQEYQIKERANKLKSAKKYCYTRKVRREAKNFCCPVCNSRKHLGAFLQNGRYYIVCWECHSKWKTEIIDWADYPYNLVCILGILLTIIGSFFLALYNTNPFSSDDIGLVFNLVVSIGLLCVGLVLLGIFIGTTISVKRKNKNFAKQELARIGEDDFIRTYG